MDLKLNSLGRVYHENPRPQWKYLDAAKEVVEERRGRITVRVLVVLIAFIIGLAATIVLIIYNFVT